MSDLSRPLLEFSPSCYRQNPHEMPGDASCHLPVPSVSNDAYQISVTLAEKQYILSQWRTHRDGLLERYVNTESPREMCWQRSTHLDISWGEKKGGRLHSTHATRSWHKHGINSPLYRTTVRKWGGYLCV